LQVAQAQHVQGAQLHSSHLQQLLHVFSACAASAVPVRAVAMSTVIRIFFIIFSCLGFVSLVPVVELWENGRAQRR